MFRSDKWLPHMGHPEEAAKAGQSGIVVLFTIIVILLVIILFLIIIIIILIKLILIFILIKTTLRLCGARPSFHRQQCLARNRREMQQW